MNDKKMFVTYEHFPQKIHIFTTSSEHWRFNFPSGCLFFYIYTIKILFMERKYVPPSIKIQKKIKFFRIFFPFNNF